MKSLLHILFVTSVFAACSCTQEAVVVDDAFLGDLGSENNRIAATLVPDVYPDGFMDFTFDKYLSYLAANETPSARGLKDIISKANGHFFRASKNEFLLLLHYKDAGKLVADFSGTTFSDSVVHNKVTFDTSDVKIFCTRYGF